MQIEENVTNIKGKINCGRSEGGAIDKSYGKQFNAKVVGLVGNRKYVVLFISCYRYIMMVKIDLKPDII